MALLQDAGGFLAGHIGPVPVWVVIVGGGIAAVFLLPGLLSKLGIGGSSTPSATTSLGASSGTSGSTDASLAGTASQLPSNIDPITGVPYDVESQTNPNTGVPNYYGGPGITQPVPTAGAGGDTPSAPIATPIVGPPTAPTPTPTPPASSGPTQAQMNAAVAIAAWEGHTGVHWGGPPGSFPAGWGPTPNAPGAAQYDSSNVFHWKVPLAASGGGPIVSPYPRQATSSYHTHLWPYY